MRSRGALLYSLKAIVSCLLFFPPFSMELATVCGQVFRFPLHAFGQIVCGLTGSGLIKTQRRTTRIILGGNTENWVQKKKRKTPLVERKTFHFACEIGFGLGFGYEIGMREHFVEVSHSLEALIPDINLNL